MGKLLTSIFVAVMASIYLESPEQFWAFLPIIGLFTAFAVMFVKNKRNYE
jgi:hypothetical protein